MIVTTVNGKEMTQYDALNRHIAKLEKYFVETDEYVGFPPLPDFWLEVEELYNNAGTDEQNMMFMRIYLLLLESYRHWTTDLDALWRDEEIEKHLQVIEKCKDMQVWKKEKRNWSNFGNSM